LQHIENATKRETAKGRQAKRCLRLATETELTRAEKVFGRTALSWADVEFLVPILSREDAA